jgi:hypothetical protein
MELTPQYARGSDRLLPHKYATMHHLSINALKWLNVGIFEAVIFDRRDKYEFSYMIPIILYRQVERSLGSPDNVVLGLNFKAIAAKHLQFYGQLLLDEFTSKELIAGNGYWANKFGVQFGGKYFNAFGVNNLDLQGEINIVRPYTYSHFDSTANYTHYNQPLAHPLGANFQEWIGILRYQPFPKWNVYARTIYYYKGMDTANANFGGNIFKSYLTRLTDDGFNVGSGDKATCLNTLFNVSYEFRQNLFFEASIQNRNYKQASGFRNNSTSFTAGIRLNIQKREYDF